MLKEYIVAETESDLIATEIKALFEARFTPARLFIRNLRIITTNDLQMCNSPLRCQ